MNWKRNERRRNGKDVRRIYTKKEANNLDVPQIYWIFISDDNIWYWGTAVLYWYKI
jgi:hypothetical protein